MAVLNDEYVKDPGAILDYVIDWTNGPDGGYLEAGEVVLTSSWTVPDGLTKGVPHVETTDGTTSTVWLSGGTAHTEYRVTCHITTSFDRTDERSIIIRVEDR